MLRNICALSALIAISSAHAFASSSGSDPAPTDPASSPVAAATAGAAADAAAGEAATAPPSGPRRWFGHSAWSEWDQLLGDWNGARLALERRGITASSTLTSDWSDIRSADRRALVGRSLVDASVSVDLSQLGVRETTVFAQVLGKFGGNGADVAGDLQSMSSIDAPSFRNHGEVWVERWLFSRLVRIKAGWVDANSEFAGTEAGSDFHDAAMGYSPSIFSLPTYPNPALSVNAFVHAGSHWFGGAGLYDGMEHDADVSPSPATDRFVIGHVGATWEGHGLDGRFAVGGWRHTGLVYDLHDDGLTDGTWGPFVVCEQTIWRSRATKGRSAAAFFQVGSADPSVSPVSSHVGGGVRVAGLLAGRPDDVLGIGFTRATLSYDREAGEWLDPETAVGVFYKWWVTPALAFSPAVQYVRHPSGRLTGQPAVSLTIRSEIAF